jgi:hypothetical protein
MIRAVINPKTIELSDQLLEDLKVFPQNHALIAFRQTIEGLFD